MKEFKQKQSRDSEKDTRKKSRQTRSAKGGKFRASEEGPTAIDAKKDKDTYIHGHNDISWLTHNPVMANVASRVPFGRPSGYAFDQLFKLAKNVSGIRTEYVVPGILTIPSYLGAGIASSANSPINQAALNLWVKLRQAGTGSLVDDPNDVALYYLSIAQLIAMVGWLRRLMAEISAVNPLNRYVRQGLVYSEGVDYDDLTSHYSEFAFFVAWFAAQVNNFVFPKIPYFDQAYTAFHYIYKDESTAKAQYYMITPIAFGLFNPTYNEKGAALEYNADTFASNSDFNCPGNGMSYSALTNSIRSFLDSLINDQATATLSAAVLKAYGEGELWRLSDIDVLHEQVEIVMDAELLMQIHNIQLNRRIDAIINATQKWGYSSEMPTPESGLSPYLVSINPSFTVNHSEDLDHYLGMYMDAFTEEPSGAEVILMSRLKSIESYALVDSKNTISAISEDAIVPVFMFKVSLQSDGEFTSFIIPQVQKAIGVNVYRRYIPEFQFAPLLYNFGSGDQQDELIGEIHNFTTIENRVVEDLHLNNLLSLFNVPLHR